MASKPFPFTEGSLKAENKEHLFDFVVTLLNLPFVNSAQIPSEALIGKQGSIEPLNPP